MRVILAILFALLVLLFLPKLFWAGVGICGIAICGFIGYQIGGSKEEEKYAKMKENQNVGAVVGMIFATIAWGVLWTLFVK